MRDKNDSLKENDKVFAKLLCDEKVLKEIKIEIEKYIEDHIKFAKFYLQKNDRENAKINLIDKLKCEKLIEKCDKKLENINEDIVAIYYYENDPEYKKMVDDSKFLEDIDLKQSNDILNLIKNDDILKILEETEIEENEIEENKYLNDVKSLEEYLK